MLARMNGMAAEMTRVISLLASGTEIVCALGAGDRLVGRSHECDNPAWVAALPCCSSAAFDTTLSSGEIDREVKRRIRAGDPLYCIDDDLIRSLAPDLIVTQAHCQVCAVTPDDLSSRPAARTVVLTAFSLDDIFAGVTQVADALDVADRGREVVRQERAKLDAVKKSTAGKLRPTVAMLEWADPLFAMGNWGPELVEIAGGIPVLGKTGEYSSQITPEMLCRADPEFLVIAPCGFPLERSWNERKILEAIPGWDGLKAVREGKVAFADGNQLFNRSGMTVARSAETLAEILHGPGVSDPAGPADFRWYTDHRVRIS